MGGAASAAPEVSMDTMDDRCPFCGVDALEPATETVNQALGGVSVTVEGVPAERCRNCGEVGIVGRIAIPVDEAIRQILVATGVAAAPNPQADEALRDEMAALARNVGQVTPADRRSKRAAS
jgi:YgiT-type zinc finger domain-containing protein